MQLLKDKNRRTSIIFLILLPLILISGCPSKPYKLVEAHIHIQKKGRENQEWVLVWEDNFDGISLDTTKWTVMTPGGDEWSSSLSDDKQVYAVYDNKLYLKIISNPNKDDDRKYLSSGISSRNKFAFQYGKIEICARLEQARGAWPAMWMKAVQADENPDGLYDEIVVMEHHNYDEFIYQLIHLKKPDLPPNIYANTITTTVRSKVYDYNVYGLEWYPDSLVFTFNDETKYVYPRTKDGKDNQWNFDQPYYLMINQQFGGWWMEDLKAIDLPFNIIIDYVKVYQ